MSDFSSSEIPNSSDAISRQAAIDSFRYDDDGTAWNMDDIVYRLEQFPSVQPEREKGKWIADNHDFWVCSNCKFPSEAHGANILYKFCPNCGADMRGEQDG